MDKLYDQSQEILKRCDSFRIDSKKLRTELRKRSITEHLPKFRQQPDLHKYLEKQILQSASQNKRAAKYVKKQFVSPYLQNPALYTKMLTSVTRRRLSHQSIVSRQFNVHQNKNMHLTINRWQND